MKGMQINPTLNIYDVYSATYKYSENGNFIIDGKWEFSDTIVVEKWKDVWENNNFIIRDDYYFLLCNESTVCLIAEYNTKNYINLQKLYDEYHYEKYKAYNRRYKSYFYSRHRHYKIYREPHTTHNLRNMVSKEEVREYKESYPNTKLSLKNSRIKNLPTSWNDSPRHYSRSWKDCTKKKSQYKSISYKISSQEVIQ